MGCKTPIICFNISWNLSVWFQGRAWSACVSVKSLSIISNVEFQRFESSCIRLYVFSFWLFKGFVFLLSGHLPKGSGWNKIPAFTNKIINVCFFKGIFDIKVECRTSAIHPWPFQFIPESLYLVWGIFNVDGIMWTINLGSLQDNTTYTPRALCDFYVVADNSLVIVIGYRSPAVMGDSYVAGIGFISWLNCSCVHIQDASLELWSMAPSRWGLSFSQNSRKGASWLSWPWRGGAKLQVRSCGCLIECQLGLLVDNPVLVAPVWGGFQDLQCCLKWDENRELLESTMHQHVLHMYLDKANSMLLRTQPPNKPAFKLLPNALNYMAVLSGHMCKRLNVDYTILADSAFRWQGRILS